MRRLPFPRGGPSVRWRVTVAGLAALLALVPLSGSAAAAPSRTGGARSLAVSVPNDPVPIRPGRTGTVPLRIVNPGPRPITVTVQGRAVHLGNHGKVAMGTGPDPIWRDHVRFPTGPVRIGAQGYVTVHVQIHVPSRQAPDLYFIGFLVTPLSATRGDLTVINQIGWFATIDVPGPRVRTLRASIAGPHFVLGSGVTAQVTARNVGRAAAQYWGENDVTSWPGGSIPKEHRISASLLPAGTSESFAVHGAPIWPVAVVTMRVQVVYPSGSGATTRQVELTERVVVVNPVVLAIVGGTAAAAVVILWRRRRRRRLSEARRVPRVYVGRRSRPPGPVARSRVLVDR